MSNSKAKSVHSHVPVVLTVAKICCVGRNGSIKAYLVKDNDDVDTEGYRLEPDATSLSNRFPMLRGNVVPSSSSVKCPRSDTASVPVKGNLTLLAQN
jgi:hypothetical protein